MSVLDAGNPTPLLEVRNVGVTLASREILRDVNFRVNAGEFTGLIGSNGAGKTTLLRVILGLLELSAGRVLLHGAALSRENRHIGYVPQKVVFDPDMPVRVRDFVALGVDGHRFGFARRSHQTRSAVESTLDAVDASDLAERRIGALSGGEQQRVLIAHALVSQPDLLLLDEPLANLDPHSVHEVVRVLRGVADRGVALLLSAHEMNALLPAMDRVVYVANGRVASGTTEEVVQSSVLSALYGQHVDVLRVHGRLLVVGGDDAETAPSVPEHAALIVE